MVRIQIYLTERQRRELVAIAKTTGRKQSELIREANDQLIEQSSKARRQAILRETAGIWKDRELQVFKIRMGPAETMLKGIRPAYK